MTFPRLAAGGALGREAKGAAALPGDEARRLLKLTRGQTKSGLTHATRSSCVCYSQRHERARAEEVSWISPTSIMVVGH